MSEGTSRWSTSAESSGCTEKLASLVLWDFAQSSKTGGEVPAGLSTQQQGGALSWTCSIGALRRLVAVLTSLCIRTSSREQLLMSFPESLQVGLKGGGLLLQAGEALLNFVKLRTEMLSEPDMICCIFFVGFFRWAYLLHVDLQQELGPDGLAAAVHLVAGVSVAPGQLLHRRTERFRWRRGGPRWFWSSEGSWPAAAACSPSAGPRMIQAFPCSDSKPQTESVQNRNNTERQKWSQVKLGWWFCLFLFFRLFFCILRLLLFA